jgi:hypothetical protein
MVQEGGRPKSEDGSNERFGQSVNVCTGVEIIG